MMAALWFWIGVAVVLYAYLGYPLLICALARLRAPVRGRLLDEGELPGVTVVIAAHNEAARLPAKLRNVFDLDYPRDRLRVLVVSDGSTDGTEQVASTHPGVQAIGYAPRRGKAYALNRAMAEVGGDVVVFCDVRQDLAPDAVRRIVSSLCQPGVGVVSGELIHHSGKTATGQSIGLYWRYEKWLRACESRLYSTVGATGALYAIRREDWEPLREGTILDDFEVPMRIVRKGQRSLFDAGALVWDTLHEDPRLERRRKIRTLSGNFQSFLANAWLFLPWENPVWFQFLSHKVSRLLVPYALAICLVCSAFAGGLLIRMALLAQLLFYALALAGAVWSPARRIRVVSFAYVFSEMNLAAVLALGRFVRGRADGRWEKTS